MSTVANSLSVKASMAWKQTKTITGFATAVQGPDSLSFSVAPSASTYTNVLISQFPLAAAGTQTVDFYSVTDQFGTAVSITKLLALFLKVTATVTGGILKIENGGSSPLAWPLTAGTTPAISLPVGTAGLCFMICQGTAHTVSNTVKNLLFTNSGSQTITVNLTAFVGT